MTLFMVQKCVFMFCQKQPFFLGGGGGIPSHIGIRGKERADSAAKSALDLPLAKVGVPYNDFFKHCVSQYILSTW